MNKEVEELLKKIEEKEKIIRKYELLLNRFKISDEQKNVKTNEVLEELEMLHDCSTAMQELPSSNWVEYVENEAELDLKLYFGYEHIKQALIKAQELEKENAKYKQLEELLGCSLDVIRQLFSQDFIYFKYLGNVQIMKVKVIKGLSSGSNLGWHFTCIYANLDFIYVSLKDYKRTWWLKEDRSE